MCSRTRQKMAGFLIAIVTILGAQRENLAAAPDMLGKLNLSTYPSATKAPPFSGRTTTDQVVSLAGLQGRVVLLNFWATWCQECRPEMPMFQRLHILFHCIVGSGATTEGARGNGRRTRTQVACEPFHFLPTISSISFSRVGL